MDRWDDKEFIKELERRTKSFLDGTAKGYTWEEVQVNAKKALAEKKRRDVVKTYLSKRDNT